MLVAFFESIKYVGHLFPIALLRVYIGYFYINQALTRYGSDFLHQPQLAEAANYWLPHSIAPEWYQIFVQSWMIPHWQIFAAVIVVAEVLIGISFVLGYMVRPFCILGFLLSLNMLWIYGPEFADLHQTFLAIHITLAWVGAGRCLGMDYFYYKKRRGVWW